MLPQENDASRFSDLPELGIYTSGVDDGRFDDQDFILFYAQSPDLVAYDQSGDLIYEKNLYSDLSYYFLTVQEQPGKRLVAQSNEGIEHPVIDSYQDYFVSEVDRTNLLSSGREWYGQIFTSNSSDYVLEIPSEDLVNNSVIRITSAVMAQSFSDFQFRPQSQRFNHWKSEYPTYSRRSL